MSSAQEMQWVYSQLLRLNRNYSVIGSSVYIMHKGESVNVGEVEYLAKLPVKQMIAYVDDIILRNDKDVQRKVQEKMEDQARRDGEMIADYMLWVAPRSATYPNMFRLCSAIGKALGYRDIDSNVAFAGAVQEKMVQYSASQTRLIGEVASE